MTAPAGAAVSVVILLAAVLYALAAAGSLASLRDRRWTGPASHAGLAAWVAHTAGLAGGLAAGGAWSAWSGVPGAVVLVTWLAAGGRYLTGDLGFGSRGRRRRERSARPLQGLDLYVFPAVAAGLLAAAALRWTAPVSGSGADPGLLAEPWIPFHAALTAIGWGLFTLAWLAGLMHRAQDRSLRRLDLGPLSKRLPPLETLDRTCLRLVAAGLLFLLVGLVPGVVRAAALWGAEWLKDPKVLSTFLAAGAYALYLAARAGFGWTAGRAAWLLSAGFLLTVLNLLVAGPFLSRLHQWL